jgi:hypothetical protein
MTAEDPERVVPIDELTAEDLTALGWAFTARHDTGTREVPRDADAKPGVPASVVAATRAAWEASGRPKPDHHVHRTSVTLIDGTEVVGVTFDADNAYSRHSEPTFGHRRLRDGYSSCAPPRDRSVRVAGQASDSALR